MSELAPYTKDEIEQVRLREQEKERTSQDFNPTVLRLIKTLAVVTSDSDFLKRREQDIIAATEPADGGQYRADIAGAIQRQRRELDEARGEISRLRAELAEAREFVRRLTAADRMVSRTKLS